MTSIIEYVRYNIPADQAESFITTFRLASPLLTAAPGCLGCELRQGVENPAEFVARVVWSSIAAHVEFRESAEFPKFKGNFAGFEIVSLGHYEKVEMD